MRELILVNRFALELLKGPGEVANYVDLMSLLHQSNYGRGVIKTTRGSLAKRWGWSPGKVRSFLEKLDKQRFVNVFCETQCTFVAWTEDVAKQYAQIDKLQELYVANPYLN